MVEMGWIVVWYLVHVVIFYSIENFYHEQHPAILSRGFTRCSLNFQDKIFQRRGVIFPAKHIRIYDRLAEILFSPEHHPTVSQGSNYQLYILGLESVHKEVEDIEHEGALDDVPTVEVADNHWKVND